MSDISESSKEVRRSSTASSSNYAKLIRLESSLKEWIEFRALGLGFRLKE